MKHLTLKGSYFEMGMSYGKLLKKMRFKLPPIPNKTLIIAQQCRDYISSIFPDYLEEIKGIADATELNYDLLCAYAIVVQEASNCSIFAIRDENQIFLGRNYDMYYNFKDYLETTLCIPQKGNKSVAQSDIFAGREDGLNETGLGVAQSGIISYIKPGLAFWVSIRYILDKCTTVKQGIDFLTDIPHYSTTMFLLADKQGKIAIVEVGPNDECMIREPEDNFLVSTNHYNHPNMQFIDIYEPPDSRSRYNVIYSTLKNNKDKINQKTIQKILSSHEGLVCSHRDEINLGTLWSVIYSLSDLRVWRSVGHPCLSPYMEDNRLREAVSECNK
jgi:predicted choloylglycine hydrolase